MAITDARPMQVRVADDLRTRIESGQLKPGEQLPTLDDLAGTYRCSLAVIRKALDLLRQQGLVTTKQGRGSFVRVPPRRVVRSSERHQREKDLALRPEEERGDQGAAEMDMGVSIHDLDFWAEYTVIPAGDRAEIFGVDPDSELLQREFTTLDRTSGHVQSHSLGWTPRDLLVGNPALLDSSNEPWPGGTHHQFRTVGIEIARMVEVVTASMPTTAEARSWGMDEGVPMLHIQRTAIDTKGRVVAFGTSFHPADRAELRFVTDLKPWE